MTDMSVYVDINKYPFMIEKCVRMSMSGMYYIYYMLMYRTLNVPHVTV